MAATLGGERVIVGLAQMQPGLLWLVWLFVLRFVFLCFIRLRLPGDLLPILTLGQFWAVYSTGMAQLGPRCTTCLITLSTRWRATACISKAPLRRSC